MESCPSGARIQTHPCSIWSRLVQYNIIAEAEQVRGYDEYLDKYAESYAALPPKPPNESSSYRQSLAELKEAIHALQKDVQEVTFMLSRVIERLGISE